VLFVRSQYRYRNAALKKKKKENKPIKPALREKQLLANLVCTCEGIEMSEYTQKKRNEKERKTAKTKKQKL